MKSVNYKATAQRLAKSWWILLTFPLGFLSWAAFLYVGARVKHRRWILYGILYLIPFGVYAVTDEMFRSSSWQLNAVIWIYIVAWVVSIIHAFMIRAEYLMRLEAYQERASRRHREMQEQVAREYGLIPQPSLTSHTVSPQGREEQTVLHQPSPNQPPVVGPAAVTARSPMDPDQSSSPPATTNAAHSDAQASAQGPLQAASIPNRAESSQQPLGAQRVSKDHYENLSHQLNSDDNTNLVHNLDLEIQSHYPFPIAFAYRASCAIHEPERRYKEQLRVAENLLAFLASAGLILAANAEALSNPHNKQLTGAFLLGCWQRGISPGDWHSLGRIAASLLREKRQTELASSFASLWFKAAGDKESDFAHLTKTLVEWKNDFKHDRGPITPEEYTQATHQLDAALRECMEHLAFFIHHPIRLVEDVEIDWRTGMARLYTLVYSGDHPSFRSEEVARPDALPTNKLYLEVTGQEWATLYPFISVQYCPSCKARETYMIDRWEGPSKPAVLKSFERGHSIRNDDAAKNVATDLEYWIDMYLPH